MSEILEGKELEGKIGDVGTYSVDIDANGKVKGLAGASYEKQVFPWLKVVGAGSLGIDADLVGGIIAYAQTSNQALVKSLANKLAVLTGRA